jgi:hypothetical protein
MRRLLLLSLLVVLVVPATAHAAVPCRNTIFNDWYADGKIASTYSHGCYVDALRHIPADASVYSSLSDDIKSAMAGAVHRTEGKPVPKQIGQGFRSLDAGVKGASVVVSTPGTHDPSTGEPDPATAGHTVAAGGGIADTASSAPLPILILGGLAIALAAAGAIGSGVKFAQRRRRP